MKKYKILVWLGIMAALTLLAMGLWFVCGGDVQSTNSLKWLQFLQTAGTFLIPPFICAWLWSDDHQPLTWLKLTNHPSPITNNLSPITYHLYLLAILIMICALPGINLLADLNSRIQLPESLASIEQILKQQEEAAALLTERFLKADNIGVLILNIGLMALLPALAEELSFRGTLQQILGNKHIAVWITAIVFSAIHMQFYGFIPRMLMGAMFGYIFVWSGSLWLPIVMHFINNGLAVIVYYILGESLDGKNYADSIGAGTTWWLGVLSIVLTSLGLLIFYRRTHIR
ncbi:MAG: CPBP family intramembrane metalloprotease [Paludibacteraceae bacterium]|nr:CPBP family intramembrane metalloprotease [Paludibacteraceae bacterium]MBR6492540.1 CPBP family intramembrane metalloprotease [Paludibacteraceae bacterium]